MKCQRCKKPIQLRHKFYLVPGGVCHDTCTVLPAVVHQAILDLENNVACALAGWLRFSIPPGDALRGIQKAFQAFGLARAKWPR